MKYLVLYTITPVQSFITEARKALDLANGSRLLSELAKIGIETAEQRGAKIVFPKLQHNIASFSLPNRFLAEFEGDAEALMREISARLREELAVTSRAVIGLWQKPEIEEDFLKQVAHYF
ncbi:MAG: hypothetical protein NZL89_07160, partial [Leptospiraceae bacterium]|nr:hypothetical protein [Leptospiraceae bacterium]